MDTAGPNVYTSNGVLILDRITPVINALFGRYDLSFLPEDDYRTDRALVRFSYNLENRLETEPTWEHILCDLVGIAHNAGMRIPADWGLVLHTLNMYFAVVNNREPRNIPSALLTWTGNPNARPDLEKLYVLASLLNDGHGLLAAYSEGAWRRNSHVGGQGLYVSDEFVVASSSLQAVAFGENVHTALLERDLNEAAIYFARALDGLLSGVVDQNVRQAIRSQVEFIAGLPPAVVPDEAYVFGPSSIDFDFLPVPGQPSRLN